MNQGKSSLDKIKTLSDCLPPLMHYCNIHYVCFQLSQLNDNIKSSRHITESFLISQMKALLVSFCIYLRFLLHTHHLSVKKKHEKKRWNLRRPEFGEKIRLSIFLQLSFLNGWSYKFLVGLNWKISSCSFHASYSFCFFERKWLSYEGFCATTCHYYEFKAYLSSFSSHF